MRNLSLNATQGNCAILATMDKNHHIWQIWVNTLHRWGVADLVASFIEAAGPLTIIGAQLLYIGSPILNGIITNGHLDALIGILEDDHQRDSFVNYLRAEVQA